MLARFSWLNTVFSFATVCDNVRWNEGLAGNGSECGARSGTVRFDTWPAVEAASDENGDENYDTWQRCHGNGLLGFVG